MTQTQTQIAEQIAEKHLGKKNFQYYGTLQRQGVIAAIAEALSLQGNGINPNWREDFTAYKLSRKGITHLDQIADWIEENVLQSQPEGRSEGDLVASNSNTDDASLASHSCTDGKAIQQIIESVKRGLWQFSLGTTGFEETTVFSDYVVRRSKEMLLLLNNGQGAQECDATMPNSSNIADNQITPSNSLSDIPKQNQDIQAKPK